MNIHVKLSGEAERAVQEIINRGYAANKTEAIRHAVLDCVECHLSKPRIGDISEEEFYKRLGEESLMKDWDNPKDREAASWYEKQRKKGAYNELDKASKK